MPGEVGDSCNKAFANNKFTLPNIPHYRLYDAQGSTCDTLGIDEPAPPEDYWRPGPDKEDPPPEPSCDSELQTFSNPGAEYIRVRGPRCSGGRLELYNVAGVRVVAIELADQIPDGYRLDTAELPSGMYLLRYQTPQGKSYTHKLVIAH